MRCLSRATRIRRSDRLTGGLTDAMERQKGEGSSRWKSGITRSPRNAKPTVKATVYQKAVDKSVADHEFLK